MSTREKKMKVLTLIFACLYGAFVYADSRVDFTPDIPVVCTEEAGTSTNDVLVYHYKAFFNEAETTLKIKFTNFNCVKGRFQLQDSKGIGTPYITKKGLSFNVNLPQVRTEKIDGANHEVTITASNEVLESNHKRKFKLVIPFGLKRYTFTVSYIKVENENGVKFKAKFE
jgi:type 1 fimbria pilin